MKTRSQRSITHAEMQAQIGRAITQIRLARQIAEAKSQDGLSEDLFMLEIELKRILDSTRDERMLARYDRHRSSVSQTRMET